jgi:translocation and assembly module TamB
VLSVHLTNTQLAAGDVELGRSEARIDYRAARTTVAVQLTSQNGGALKLDGALTLDLSYPAFRRGLEPSRAPLEATLVSKNFDLAFTTGFTALVRELKGTLEIDAHAGGTLGSPRGQGTLEWKEGRLWLAGYGQYRQVHLLLEASNDRIVLQDLQAHTDTGSLKLTAGGDRQGERWALKANSDITNFPIFVDDQLLATASVRIDLVGEATPKATTLQPVRIPEAHLELPAQSRRDLQPLSRPDDIILIKNGVPLDPRRARAALERDPGLAAELGGALPPAPRGKPYPVILVLDAPGNLWLKSPDINLEVGLGPDFRLEISDPTTMFGEVRVLHGRLDVLGRRFDIQRNSVVRFTGPPAEPALDVTAVYTNIREQVKVSMTVQGQGKSISLVPSSQPPMSEAEIYTLLATGRRSLKRGAGSSEIGSAAAVSVLGSLAASQLQGAVNTKVGLDVVSVSAGESGTLEGATLEAGKYITDELYLGYAGKTGADPGRYENSNAFRLEYQFLPRWSLEAVYGDAKSGSADIVWSRDY